MIDYTALSHYIQKAIELKGADYIYPQAKDEEGSCRYVEPDGSASCIIGHILPDLDLRIVFDSAENLTNFGGLGLDLTPKALSYGNRVQELQDLGWEWGQANDRAHQEVSDLGEWDE